MELWPGEPLWKYHEYQQFKWDHRNHITNNIQWREGGLALAKKNPKGSWWSPAEIKQHTEELGPLKLAEIECLK